MSENPSAFKTEKRKSRRVHICCECDSVINVGDNYQYSSGIWGGEPADFKQCMICYEIIRAALSIDDDHNLAFGELKDFLFNFANAQPSEDDFLNDLAIEIGVDQEKLNHLLKIQ